MTGSEDIRLIHLARMPEVRTSRGNAAPYILRAILAAIAIETDNGRVPARIVDIAISAGVGVNSPCYFGAMLREMERHGLIRQQSGTRASGIGCLRAASWAVDFEALRRLARKPLSEDGPVMDPLGVASWPAPAPLFALRDRVLDQHGVGVAFVGNIAKEVPRNDRSARLRVRAMVCREIRARWSRAGHQRLPDEHLGGLLGLRGSQVRKAIKAFPVVTPKQQGAAA